MSPLPCLACEGSGRLVSDDLGAFAAHDGAGRDAGACRACHGTGRATCFYCDAPGAVAVALVDDYPACVDCYDADAQAAVVSDIRDHFVTVGEPAPRAIWVAS